MDQFACNGSHYERMFKSCEVYDNFTESSVHLVIVQIVKCTYSFAHMCQTCTVRLNER